jgi:hopanoid biosynthesis associated protein HpnK
MEPDRPRRLIVNADDFGSSRDVNEAVIRAHRDGILTSASLMVNEPAATEAVALARQHPTLGVGLHLVLAGGRAALPPRQIPGLADDRGQFAHGAVRAGFRLFFRHSLRAELEREIAAQFRAFSETGLTLDHVNGHLNLHLHPTVFPLALAGTARHPTAGFRLTRDSFRLDLQLSRGAWVYRISHAAIFTLLSAFARSRLKSAGVRHTDRVFGLLRNARVDEHYLLALLPRLPPGDSELYAHPSLTAFRHELEALTSPMVKTLANRLNLRLIRYRDL